MTWYRMAIEKLRQDITQNHLKKFIKNVKTWQRFDVPRATFLDVVSIKTKENKRIHVLKTNDILAIN